MRTITSKYKSKLRYVLSGRNFGGQHRSWGTWKSDMISGVKLKKPLVGSALAFIKMLGFSRCDFCFCFSISPSPTASESKDRTEIRSAGEPWQSESQKFFFSTIRWFPLTQQQRIQSKNYPLLRVFRACQNCFMHRNLTKAEECCLRKYVIGFLQLSMKEVTCRRLHRCMWDEFNANLVFVCTFQRNCHNFFSRKNSFLAVRRKALETR